MYVVLRPSAWTRPVRLIPTVSQLIDFGPVRRLLWWPVVQSRRLCLAGSAVSPRFFLSQICARRARPPNRPRQALPAAVSSAASWPSTRAALLWLSDPARPSAGASPEGGLAVRTALPVTLASCCVICVCVWHCLWILCNIKLFIMLYIILMLCQLFFLIFFIFRILQFCVLCCV